MKTQQKVEAIRKAIRALEQQAFVIETNAGTYGATEAQRATGTGDPKANDYQVWETVTGKREFSGCHKSRAPGYARYFRPAGLVEARKQLADLKRQLAEAL